MPTPTPETDPRLQRARWRLLINVVKAAEPLMVSLGLVWLVLLVVEFTRGLTPGLTLLSAAIWFVFVVDFAAQFLIAPDKVLYLRRHWLTALSLAVPALRITRVARVWRFFRVARAARGVRLLRTITSVNRAIASLRATMGRRGFGYVSATTCVVTFTGAAAIYAFENEVPNPAGIHDFGAALWWTAMMMTTMGSAYWPETSEGRLLCLFLALYAFAVFGYVTATIATFFVSRDAERSDAPIAGQQSVEHLRSAIEALQRELAEARVTSQHVGTPSQTDQGVVSPQRPNP
jgi:voltage-gated potassium channel